MILEGEKLVWSEAEDTTPKQPEPPKPRGNTKKSAKGQKKGTPTTGVGIIQRRGGKVGRPRNQRLNLGNTPVICIISDILNLRPSI